MASTFRGPQPLKNKIGVPKMSKPLGVSIHLPSWHMHTRGVKLLCEAELRSPSARIDDQMFAAHVLHGFNRKSASHPVELNFNIGSECVGLMRPGVVIAGSQIRIRPGRGSPMEHGATLPRPCAKRVEFQIRIRPGRVSTSDLHPVLKNLAAAGGCTLLRGLLVSRLLPDPVSLQFSYAWGVQRSRNAGPA